MTKDMSRLRNVVLAGHSDSGKTTLAEHLLHAAGAINRLGKVDDGTTLLDFEPEEQKRKQSLALAMPVETNPGSVSVGVSAALSETPPTLLEHATSLRLTRNVPVGTRRTQAIGLE